MWHACFNISGCSNKLLDIYIYSAHSCYALFRPLLSSSSLDELHTFAYITACCLKRLT